MKTKRVAILMIISFFFICSFQKKKKKWVAIGDSITYLNDHKNETGDRVSEGYLSRVTDYFHDLEYTNKGYNGWTSGNIAAKIDSLGLSEADIYSVFLGTNDWWQGRTSGTLEDYKNSSGNSTVYGSFRIILDKLRHINPSAHILLITPMQRADFVYINRPSNNAFGSYKPKNGHTLEEFVNAIDSIAQYEKLPIIDLFHNSNLSVDKMVKFKRLKDPETGLYKNYGFPESTNIPYNPTTDEYPYPLKAINLTYDGLHPSDKGNKIIARAIISQFKQIGF